MSKAEKGETLGTHAPKRLIRIIEARGAALSLTKSRYAAMILEHWERIGCPPVSDPDKHMAADVMARLEQKKHRQAAPALIAPTIEEIEFGPGGKRKALAAELRAIADPRIAQLQKTGKAAKAFRQAGIIS